MTNIVDSTEIEHIVGCTRQLGQHMARAVTVTRPVAEDSDIERKAGTFYILHSKQCVQTQGDLRECVFSLSLDKHGIDMAVWESNQDRPISIGINHKGKIVPLFSNHG